MPREPQVWVNARFLTQKLTGVQRYAHNLVKRMPHARLVSPGPPLEIYGDVDSSRLKLVPSVFKDYAWDQLVAPFATPKNAALWYVGGAGSLIHRQPTAINVHDMAVIEHPEWWSRGFAAYYGAMLPKAAKRADLVITDSEYSKSRIIAAWRIPEDRIAIVPGGVEEQFSPAGGEVVRPALSALGIDAPYVLSVSAVSERKNFRRLIESWRLIEKRFPDVWLVIVGDLALAFSSMSSLGTLPPRVRHLQGVGNVDLITLYRGAEVFAYPSLYEGFGLPMLEAMACGTPVVAADATCLPEVAGDAAVLVDPLSIESIADGISTVLSDANVRDALRAKGLAKAATYTWDTAAVQMWSLLTGIAP